MGPDMKLSPSEGAIGEVEKKRPTARDSWIKAFIEGNAVIPQANTGLHLLSAEAAINDPPDDWNNFASSSLTPEQVESGNLKMHAAHRAAGVPVATPDGFHMFRDFSGVRGLSRDRLQQLWTITSEVVLRLLAYYVSVSKNYVIVLTDNPANSLNALFKDERNKKCLEDLKLILKTAIEVLRGDVVKPLLDEFKRGFDKRIPQPDMIDEIQKERKKKISQILAEETIKALPNLDQKMLKQFVPEIVSASTRRIFLPENFNE